MSGTSRGFRLVILKMESAAPSSRIAEFYQKALATYGSVLDCTNVTEAADNDNDDTSDRLTCANHTPEPGKRLFKAGTKHRQHLVGISSSGGKTLFQLISIEG